MASKYKEGDGLEQLHYSGTYLYIYNVVSIINKKFNFFNLITTDQITSTGTSLGDIRFRKPKIDHKDPDNVPIYDLRGYEYKNRKSSRSLFSVSRGDLRNLIILILVAFIVRLYRLDQPTSVV